MNEVKPTLILYLDKNNETQNGIWVDTVVIHDNSRTSNSSDKSMAVIVLNGGIVKNVPIKYIKAVDPLHII